MPATPTPYRKSRMTNWFQPSMLLNIALKTVISGTFGNYADRRELQAALSNHADDGDLDALRQRFVSRNEEIWVDFICDTGDGFDSTFSVARTAAKKKLTLATDHADDGIFATQRGDILILGGDEVYPYPTAETYNNKFRVPFVAAADGKEELTDDEAPVMCAIPGNHDWYDGLGNFMKLFCQQRRIGLWKTVQRRSYFAIPLPGNYWVWATDIQLNSDIDQPQLDYFGRIAREEMAAGDKVILVTAEPAWVYKAIHKNDKSFDRLQFFVDRHIHDAYDVIGKKFRLAVTITGDLHHYSRYSVTGHGHQYITSGGGGAFLHLTHNLPEALEAVNDKQAGNTRVVQQSIFPSKSESRQLLLGNLLFPFKNIAFTALTWLVYLYLFWLFQGRYSALHSSSVFLSEFRGAAFGDRVATVTSYFLNVPSIALGIGLLFAGFCLFADRIVNRKGTLLVGLLHAACQTVLLLSAMFILAEQPLIDHWGVWYTNMSVVALFCVAGGTASALLMGIYLFLSNLLLGMHLDEASSSLAHPHYKNFVRMCIRPGSITLYPIGIRKVPTNWKVSGCADDVKVSGDTVEAQLIERPIVIREEDL